MPWDLVARACPILWVTGTGRQRRAGPDAPSCEMLARRGRPAPGSGRHTVLDLDWRAMFWPSPDEARAEYDRDARLASPSSSATATRSRSPSAPRDPHEAADRLLDRGVELALVKMGGEGVLVATPDARTVVPPHPVEVVCGLGAGDAFGGALVHGLLSGWDASRIAEYANAAGAVVASRLACADAMPTMAELDALVAPRGAAVMTTTDLPVADRTGPDLLGRRRGAPAETSARPTRDAVADAYAARRRPPGRLLSERGSLFLVAADHPARGCARLRR